jgi:hypothetical protein
MFDKPWKIRIAQVPLIIAFFGLFIRFVPWLFGSKPISDIYNYDLDNLPPPDNALSFSINHGSAIYFNEKIPSEEPNMVMLAISSFLIVFVLLFLLGMKLKKIENDT